MHLSFLALSTLPLSSPLSSAYTSPLRRQGHGRDQKSVSNVAGDHLQQFEGRIGIVFDHG